MSGDRVVTWGRGVEKQQTAQCERCAFRVRLRLVNAAGEALCVVCARWEAAGVPDEADENEAERLSRRLRDKIDD